MAEHPRTSSGARLRRLRRLPFEYAVRNLGRSPARSLQAAGGIAAVVLLVVGAASFARGMTRVLDRPPGLHHNVLLVGSGSEDSTERSRVAAGVDRIVAASIPGLAERDGRTLVSPEVHAALPARAPGGEEANAILRGVRPEAFLVHAEARLVEGRLPRTGADEVIAGDLAPTRVGTDDLPLGAVIEIAGRDWTVVGRFTAPGRTMNAELWMPLGDLQVILRRDDLSCVVATLDAATLGDLEAFCLRRLDLELSAVDEADYERVLAGFYRPVRMMAWVAAALVGLGALLGGLNTTYAAFAARVREVGMLQAVGYGRGAIVLSLLQESLVAAAAGSLAGCGLGVLLLDGRAVRITMGAFALETDGPVVAIGLAAGLVAGAIGVAAPAVRCLRLPVPEALRA